MTVERRASRRVFAGGLPIGGGAPVVLQTMLTEPLENLSAALAQTRMVADAGCELIRVAVPDEHCIENLKTFVGSSPVPVCADIHFDWRLALLALESGVHKLRLNPGNMLRKEKLADIAALAAERRTPIRIGVNEGSLSKAVLRKYGGVTAEALAESVLNEVGLLENLNFTDIVVSVKTFSLPLLIEVHRLLAGRFDYPFHIGVTEAGTSYAGSIRSAVGIGTLLMSGIGDTVRVSLTASPLEEIRAGKEILKAAGVRNFGPVVVSCPTCGRTQIDLIGLACRVEEFLKDCRKNITVAVMGCIVNGPGEARNADVGIAGGKGEGAVFVGGKIVRRVPEAQLFEALAEELDKI